MDLKWSNCAKSVFGSMVPLHLYTCISHISTMNEVRSFRMDWSLFYYIQSWRCDPAPISGHDYFRWIYLQLIKANFAGSHTLHKYWPRHVVMQQRIIFQMLWFFQLFTDVWMFSSHLAEEYMSTRGHLQLLSEWTMFHVKLKDHLRYLLRNLNILH